MFLKRKFRIIMKRTVKREFRDYQEKLIQDLQDPEEASLYLNEALKDEDPRIFLLALKNVCEAQGDKFISPYKKSTKKQPIASSTHRLLFYYILINFRF